MFKPRLSPTAEPTAGHGPSSPAPAAPQMEPDARAGDTANELVAALSDEAAARARLAFYESGSQQHDDAARDVRELGEVIVALERALSNWSWTEEA
jgi:hypothetical protein